jgi:hypothetical protein
MILRLRIPNKLLVGALTVTGAAGAGGLWTFQQGAGVPSNVPTFVVTVAKNGNYNRDPSTFGGGFGEPRKTWAVTARGKTGRDDRYVSQMLALAAGSQPLAFRLEDRNLGFGANGVAGFVNGVQKERNLDSFTDASVNPGHLAIPQGATPPIGDGGPVHNIPPSSSVPSSPASVPDSGSTFLLMLCCGAGLLIMGKLGSPQLEK